MTTENKKNQTAQILAQIARISKEKYHTIDNIGVLGGVSGIALFHFYYSKWLDTDTHADTGAEILGYCMDKINSGYSYPTYCNGIAGFGWVLQHLVDQDFIALDLDEILNPLDDYLQKQMQTSLSNGNYDFLHGALGYGFYFLKRYTSTNGITKIRYKEYLEQLVVDLHKIAVYENDTYKWESILNVEKGNRGFNLSLSHGISSIICILSKIHGQNIEKNLVGKLIEGATNFALSLEDTKKSGISFYPNWFEHGKDMVYNGRVAWCYGDLGIAMALKRAGHIMQDTELVEKANMVFLDVSQRKLPENTFVRDPGYCHGSFGNANIFQSLYQFDGQNAYKLASDFWIKDGLDRYTGESLEPFKQWSPMDNNWRFELGLLEGITGIGLSLIDYLSEETHTWNESLLIY